MNNEEENKNIRLIDKNKILKTERGNIAKRDMPFIDSIIFPAYTPTTCSPNDGSNKMDSWRFPGNRDGASVFFLWYVKSFIPLYIYLFSCKLW